MGKERGGEDTEERFHFTQSAGGLEHVESSQAMRIHPAALSLLPVTRCCLPVPDTCAEKVFQVPLMEELEKELHEVPKEEIVTRSLLQCKVVTSAVVL